MSNHVTSAATCQCCGEEIDPRKGRANRKFCNDRCRSTYHNKKQEELRAEVKPINEVLVRNLSVMKELLGEKTSVKVPKEKMLRMGYNFSYCTQVYKEYVFCYGYGHTVKPDDKIQIVKGFENVVNRL